MRRLPLQPSINLGPNGSGLAGVGLVVFSPGNPGPLADNEYTDWGAAVAALSTFGAGTKYLQVDTSFSGPFPNFASVPSSAGQPGGYWDMNQAFIIGLTGGGTITLLAFEDGAQITNCQGFQYGVLAQPRGSTPVVELGGSGPFPQRGFLLQDSLIITAGGATAPFFNFGTSGPLPPLPPLIVFLGSGGIADFGPPYAPLVEVGPGVSATMEFNTPGRNCIDPGVVDWLASDVTSTVSFTLPSDVNGNINYLNLPSHLGTTEQLYVDALERPFVALAAPGELPRLGHVVVTAATATLRSASLCVGPLWVKNSSGGPLTVSPDGADTINGAASLVIADGDVVQLKSDSSAGWQSF